ncbi:MAG: gamma-glutamyltransferase, partial [Alphaproteobacteria bacterium]|nr:gamma-glutamyltransferase [Alphaproteobacteria bacterium]
MPAGRSAIRNSRPLIMGFRAAVASNHPAATQVGLDVLRHGGNAVDATVAVALAIGVVEPHMSGLGGDGFYHVLNAGDGRSLVFNGAGGAPAAATVARFRGAADGIPQRGALAASVPGMLAALAAMHRRFGSRPWSQLVAPAAALARDGFAATHNYRLFAGSARGALLAGTGTRAFLGTADAPPPIGARMRQPELAATLDAIAADGAETFYRGALAHRLAAAVRADGGLLDAGDLADFAPDLQPPIRAGYRGFEVRQTPPNSMGFSILQALRILERFDVAALGWGSAALIHHLVEVRKRVLVDRDRHGGDPRRTPIPLDALLGDPNAHAHAAAIDPLRASDLAAPAGSDAGDTTYFCIVDAAGHAVSAIQSLCLPFGAAYVAGDT